MRKALLLLLFAIVTSSCNSSDAKNDRNKNQMKASVKKSVVIKKTDPLREKYKQAKKVNTMEAWETLIVMALEAGNDEIFDLAVAGVWEYVKSDPKAMIRLAFFKIENEQDFAKFLKSGFAKAKKEEEQKRLDEEKIRKQTISLGDFINIGGIRVLPVSVSINTFKYTDLLTFKKETTSPLLCMNIIIENITEGQVFAPITNDLLEVSSYVDNFNNKHRYPYRFETFRPNIIEFGIRKKIKPKEKLEACIPFEAPVVPNSKEFSMDLYLAKSNDFWTNYVNSYDPDRTKAIIIKFNREDISEKVD